MNCLVTGGAGFIGSYLVDKLLSINHKVVVIDDFSTGKKDNIAEHKEVIIYRQSICADLDKIFEKEKPDIVFHLAAIPLVQFSIQDPEKTHEVNVNGTLSLLNACKKFKVKRFVFSSSCAVYGDQDASVIKEDMKPDPLSPYALHKLIGEFYCRLFYKIYGLETICLRYFNVYGPRQDPSGNYAGLICKFIKLINEDVRPVIFGDGTHTRDFVFVSDIVDANISAALTDNKECFGDVFNIGTGTDVSVNEVAKLLLEMSDKELEPKHEDAVIEPAHSRADITKTKKMLGWSSKVVFKEGLKKTYDY